MQSGLYRSLRGLEECRDIGHLQVSQAAEGQDLPVGCIQSGHLRPQQVQVKAFLRSRGGVGPLVQTVIQGQYPALSPKTESPPRNEG